MVNNSKMVFYSALILRLLVNPIIICQQLRARVINTPAAKAPRIPMFFLRLAANAPPNNVEKQVTTAKRTASRFISILCFDNWYLNVLCSAGTLE
jgi:hypothetical protein